MKDTMTYTLSNGWTLTALNPEVAPAKLRDRLKKGIPATVPGEATLDLLNAGLIDNPFNADNETHQQWIGDIDWCFTTVFDWVANGHEHHDLAAQGIDTVATIQLNGRTVSSVRNYHRSYRWDIHQLLHEGTNRLSVLITSPVRFAESEEQRRGYYPHTEHHPFNQIRKPAYSFGWDWGIDSANAGIVHPISIESWSGVRIASVRPLTHIFSDGTGELSAHINVERSGNCNSGALNVSMRLSGNNVNIVEKTTVGQGLNTLVFNMQVPKVKRWWPAGYGDHPLYDLQIDVSAQNCSSEWNSHVGFREIRVDRAADSAGRAFQIYINDVSVHVRGYNWIPDDAFATRVKAANVNRAIHDLLESNSNMVRIWGGGIYESEEFYDRCDETGIMVWQDFMFACATYPEDADMCAEIEAEAREQITRLSRHASLIVWNGSNECITAYADWGGVKQALRDDGDERNAYEYGEKPWGDYYYQKLFPRLLKELDPGHIYLPSSPMSFTRYTSPNLDCDGTMHIWDVWNRVDYRKFADYTPRFADEFGYQAPPAWSTLIGSVHDETPHPFGKQMLIHQKAAGGNIKLARGMRSHLTPGTCNDISYSGVINGTPADGKHSWLIPSDLWHNIEDWHWACQLQQAQALQFGIAHMRSLEPVNAGVLIWQLNDDWPAVSWSAVDFDGHRKPLWFVSSNLFSPHFATIQPHTSERYRIDHSWEGEPVASDHLALFVLNDTRQSWSGVWTVERRRLTGELLARQTHDVCLDGPGHARIILNDEVATFDNKNAEILVAQSDNGFSRVIYNPAEVIDQQLAANPMDRGIKQTGSGYILTVTARQYSRDVFCMVDKVDPYASIDAGMVTLLPGESAQWHIDSAGVANPEAFLATNVLRSANDLHSIKTQ